MFTTGGNTSLQEAAKILLMLYIFGSIILLIIGIYVYFKSDDIATTTTGEDPKKIKSIGHGISLILIVIAISSIIFHSILLQYYKNKYIDLYIIISLLFSMIAGLIRMLKY